MIFCCSRRNLAVCVNFCVCLFCGDLLDDRKLSIFCCNGRNCLVVVMLKVFTGRRRCMLCQFNRVVGDLGLWTLFAMVKSSKTEVRSSR